MKTSSFFMFFYLLFFWHSVRGQNFCDTTIIVRILNEFEKKGDYYVLYNNETYCIPDYNAVNQGMFWIPIKGKRMADHKIYLNFAIYRKNLRNIVFFGGEFFLDELNYKYFVIYRDPKNKRKYPFELRFTNDALSSVHTKSFWISNPKDYHKLKVCE